MSMAKRLVVIDGKSVFYRGYYAMPNLSTKDGTPTGGVYGFAVLALEVVKRLDPDYVCVAWDKSKTNIRSRLALYPQYKAGRKAPPPDFYEQIPILHNLLESLSWPLYEADDYEADDLMGAFAKQANERDIECFLVTSDLDVLQLVNEKTHIYTLKKGLSNIDLFDIKSFKEKYNVEPTQWVDVKALKGDSSDNVPGVAGIGEKTALQLVAEYGSLEDVYEHVELLKPALRDKLLANREMAFLSKKLVTLMVDAPVELDFTKAKISDEIPDEFVGMLRKLEFKTLLRQAESAARHNNHTTDHNPTVGCTEIDFSRDSLQKASTRLVTLNPAGEFVVSVSPTTYSLVPIKNVTQSFVDTLADGTVIAHDLKTVLHAFLKMGLDWGGSDVHDTRIAAFMLNSLERSHELGDLLGRTVDMDESGQVVAAIWQLYSEQVSAFAEMPKLYSLARNVDFPVISLLAKMEHQGIKLNSAYLTEMSKTFEKKIGALERHIFAQADQEFNVNSPSQLSEVLYQKLQLPTWGIKKGKTGYSTGARELAKLRHLHPIVDLLSEYREYTKLKSTYIDTLPKQADDAGYVHTTFNLDVAATGRLSSTNPNLQNIPTRTDLGQAIRTAFVPGDGNVFVSADYSQFELRLAAVMADDQELIADFNAGIDVHTKTAAEIYSQPMADVTKTQRRHAKMVNFAVLYGMSPHGLSEATGMPINDAKTFIEKYFELRKPVADYIDKTIEDAKNSGFVETMFGRRRPTPDLHSSNYVIREAAKRAAANMPIQGTEADLMKMAMLQVEKEVGKKSLGMQILQIHDSIMVECPRANADVVADILKETMESVMPSLPIHLKVDVSIGKNWGEL